MPDQTSGARRYALSALTLLLFARAGATLWCRDVFQGVLDVLAATLPGWLLADVAGDLLAHGEILAGGGAGVARYCGGNGAVLPDSCAAEHDQRHKCLHDSAN